ncbi:hypothetical protein O3P69_013992 [Scylla paramamosain]|uniref:Phospholipase A2-like central domain-containing protein n=1 Tax=Scylla paramamosain TaxID=85552 RepID=A0AAW0SQQ7_SCYPA
MEREMNVGVPEHDQDASQAYEYFPSSLSAITNMTSIGNPLRKDLWRRSWGSHPLPSRTEFTPRTGARWMTFFHDQAVAAVLLSRNDTMYDCIVQEVIEKWEQRKALEYLGEIMPLQPVELPTMVHLSTLCGFLNTPRPASRPTGVNMSDQAVSYRQLGLRTELDSCCRTHDHCPVKLLPMASNYGLTNISLKTKSHCLCDLEFYRCLKAAGQSDPVAKAVGEVYFNFLQLDCLSTRPTNPIRAADDASRVTTPTDSQKEQRREVSLQRPLLGGHLLQDLDASGGIMICQEQLHSADGEENKLPSEVVVVVVSRGQQRTVSTLTWPEIAWRRHF